MGLTGRGEPLYLAGARPPPIAAGRRTEHGYGPLPYGVFDEIRLKFIAALKAQAVSAVRRTI